MTVSKIPTEEKSEQISNGLASRAQRAHIFL